MPRRALVLAVTASLLLWSGPAWAGRLHPEVETRLRALPSGGMLSVIVEMTDQADPAAAAATAPRRARGARIRAVLDALQQLATRSQGSIRAHLALERARGTVRRVVSLWIVNGLAVTATEPVIRGLAARPDVREVRPDALIPMPAPRPAIAAPATQDSEWNLAQIRAPEVWALDPTFTGVGTVVGSFDTGVDVTHPDLSSRYRGDDSISWFDPYGEHASPFDPNGHGTHTTGTAVGGDAGGTNIGVAPGARWIAAKAWNDAGFGFTSAFHEIFQWFLAPGGDLANAPDVVNSSWGFSSSGCITEFLPDVQAFRAAGIFPAFAAGNDGPDAGSVRSPGTYAEAFAVGATDIFDDIVYFSGEGPSPCDGSIKPDLGAPGDSVLSSVPGGYAVFSGTSMATPHVTGAVAVLRSINPALTVDELESVLAQGAVDLGAAGADNAYGAGRLDLFESAQIVLGGANRPTVTIVATTPTATEAGLTPGSFTVSRTGSTAEPLTVAYAVSGTATPGSDYVALPGSVTIPADSATATIVVTPIDDPLVEPDETVIVALRANAAYIVGNPGAATVTVVSDDLPADLVIAAVSAPFSAGAGTTISVTDTTQNQGNGAAGATTTKFYLSTNSPLDAGDVLLGSRAVPALAPGASSSGSATLTIPAGTAAGSYYLIAQADADNVVVEAQETNNIATRVIQIGPDLVISAFSIPSAGGAGMTIPVTDTTKNQGAGPAPASTTRFYFSKNSLLDAGDALLGSRAVPALAGGASHSASTTLTIPAGTAPGTYFVIAQADGDVVVAETQETNNLNMSFIQIGPDLLVSALSAPFAAGAGATISVTDTTRNQGGGTAAAATTGFYLSTNSALDAGDLLLGSRAVPALAPGATSSGSTAVTIPAGTAPGSYYLIAQADPDNAVAETYETNNTATWVIQIGSDLVISALSAPATAGAGMTISVSDTTRNQGSGTAAASTTRFYLSTNSLLDAGDLLLGSRAVPALAAGATSSGSTAVTIPAGTPPGSYFLIAQADADNAVAETQETNNLATRAIQIGPDLTVSSLSAPSTAGAGTTISVSDTTRNQGGGTAAASTTRLYLSTNSALDAGDLLLGSRAIPALAPGGSHSGSTAVTIPAGTPPGGYYLIAQADPDNAVAETYETNNTATWVIQIGSDLVISALSAPATAGARMTISVSDTTRNQGSGTAAASTTRFYLSTNSLLDAGDLLLGSRAIPALAAGVSSSGATPVTIPPGTATGTYYLIAQADADNVVVETLETNNTATWMIQIGADLAVSSLGAPSATGAGTAISVTDTTKNQGGGAAPASTTKFYLSTNSLLDAGDVLLGGRAVPDLAAGVSDSATTVLTIPAGTAAGAYYLIARADGDNAVAETQEANNLSSRVIQIGSDLLISALSVPTTAGAGATISVTDTTQNQGSGTAGASTTKFYLSTNSLLDAGDLLLGSRAVPALGTGASSTATTVLTIPAGTATRTYYLIAQADADNVVAETQEANNTLTRAIQIGADLVISALTIPSTAGAGATISVTDTTKNQGGGAAGASTTRFYLSKNSLLDAGDALLGSRAVPGLAAGASDAATTVLTIPAGTSPGTYFLIAQADSDSVMAETQETNNVNMAWFQIGPDLVVSTLSVPLSAGAGTTISVTDTTRNQGGGTAGASTTRFYLSTNNLRDAGDVLLGSRAVAALAPGAWDAATTLLTIPAGTAAGTYYLIAQADGDSVVAEIQETNNTATRALQISP